MSKIIKIRLTDRELEVIDDIDLIANNLEFLGFAKVVDRYSNKKIVFTSCDLILMEEVDD